MIAKRFCDKIATTRASIAAICKMDPDFPSPPAVYEWLARFDDFANWYAQAKQRQIALIGEEILEIVDNETSDMIEVEVVDRKTGEIRTITQMNFTKVQRDKLRVDTRKWLMSKLQPKLYGEGRRQEEESKEPDKVIIEGGLPEKSS